MTPEIEKCGYLFRSDNVYFIVPFKLKLKTTAKHRTSIKHHNKLHIIRKTMFQNIK